MLIFSGSAACVLKDMMKVVACCGIFAFLLASLPTCNAAIASRMPVKAHTEEEQAKPINLALSQNGISKEVEVAQHQGTAKCEVSTGTACQQGADCETAGHVGTFCAAASLTCLCNDGCWNADAKACAAWSDPSWQNLVAVDTGGPAANPEESFVAESVAEADTRKEAAKAKQKADAAKEAVAEAAEEAEAASDFILEKSGEEVHEHPRNIGLPKTTGTDPTSVELPGKDGLIVMEEISSSTNPSI